MIIQTFNIHAEHEFSVYSEIQYTWLEHLVLNRKYVIISDENIFKLYPDIFKNTNHIIIAPGESSKNLGTIEYIINKLIDHGIDRDCLIIGFGGGAICDITGFAANIFMRGIKFGFIPSTLLAQVDAAIGGKNGVNLGNYKNYIGNISQPEFILCDSSLLKTLPEIEYKCGLGEVLKYSLIAGYDLFDAIQQYWYCIKERDYDYISKLVRKCIDIKTDIVSKDLHDFGIRHILNFGHSFGHSIEVIDNIPHGIAVVKGMAIALDLSLKFNYTTLDIVNKIKALFKELNYDIEYKLTAEHFNLLNSDKKRKSGSINFVFLRDIGDLVVSNIKTDELISALS